MKNFFLGKVFASIDLKGQVIIIQDQIDHPRSSLKDAVSQDISFLSGG
jgi:hypothetical protein